MRLDDIKAVIFDMDGTLLDSMGVWAEIDRVFLKMRNIPVPNDLFHYIEGKNFNETAIFYKNHFHLKENIDEIKDIWHSMAYDKYKNEVCLKEGVFDFINILNDRHITMGIATSSSRQLAETALRSLDIMEYFDTIVTGNDIRKGKPSPEIYLKAAKNIETHPSNCLVFEDLPNGLRAGKRAGMKTCGVYDSYSVHVTELKKEIADYYIESFTELIKQL